MPLSPAFLPPVGLSASESGAPAETRRLPGVPRPLLAGLLAVSALGLLTANGPLTAASLVVLALLFALLWRPGEPPVLLFAVGYQWIQVTAKVFHADVFGQPIEALSPSPSIEMATWLSLIGLVVLALGMRLGLARLAPQGERLAESVAGFGMMRAFWIWAVGSVAASLLTNVAWSVGSLTQMLLALVSLKWATFFWLAYLVFLRREGYALFALAFGVEFVMGIGFFSGFKTVFFVTLLAVMATRVAFNGRTVVTGLALLLALLLLGSVWTVVKPAFRGQGEDGGTSQSVGGSRSDQLSSLGRLVGDLEAQDLVGGLDPLFRRVAYTDFFAYTIDYVPRFRDHGSGELWGAAVRHVFMPRLFFPDKPALPSDSEVTMEWTGQYLASDEAGTSISIGYMGEAYADYGATGMFGVVFLIGLGWGLMYWAFLRRSTVPLISLGFGLVVVMGAYLFEMASIKLVGGVLMQFMVLWVLHRVAATRLADWLSAHRLDDRREGTGVDYVAMAGSR